MMLIAPFGTARRPTVPTSVGADAQRVQADKLSELGRISVEQETALHIAGPLGLFELFGEILDALAIGCLSLYVEDLAGIA